MLSNKYIYNGVEHLELNQLQIEFKNKVIEKLKSGIYKEETIKCLCNNLNFELLATKDRYGLPVNTVICKKCGLLQTNPRMTQESYNLFYDEEYRPLYVGTQKPTEEFFLEQYNHGEQIFNYLEKNDIKLEGRVLEIGCGSGGILKFFHEKGFDVLGIDLGSQYLDYGKKQGLELVNSNSDYLVNANVGKFKLIILSHVLEHFLDIPHELYNIYTLLDDKGVLYVELPGIRNLHFSYDCDFLKFLQNAHTYHFDLNTLTQVMRWNRFELIIGNEKINSLFKKASKKNECKNYYESNKEFLLDLENNLDYYKFKAQKIQQMIDNRVVQEEIKIYREKSFLMLEEKLVKYEENSILLYGTGNHTKFLLDYLYSKNKGNKIYGLLDQDINKIGHEYFGYSVLNINNELHNIKAIVISSDVFQDIIYERIKHLKNKNIDIITIYN